MSVLDDEGRLMEVRVPSSWWLTYILLCILCLLYRLIFSIRFLIHPTFCLYKFFFISVSSICELILYKEFTVCQSLLQINPREYLRWVYEMFFQKVTCLNKVNSPPLCRKQYFLELDMMGSPSTSLLFTTRSSSRAGMKQSRYSSLTRFSGGFIWTRGPLYPAYEVSSTPITFPNRFGSIQWNDPSGKILAQNVVPIQNARNQTLDLKISSLFLFFLFPTR